MKEDIVLNHFLQEFQIENHMIWIATTPIINFNNIVIGIYKTHDKELLDIIYSFEQ